MTHLKRIAMPKSWQIERKEKKFVTRLLGQSLELSMPLNVILRDILKLVSNNKEAKKILNNKKVLVNGKTKKKIGVGLMDVISIPEINKYYRVLINKKKKIILKEIKKEESDIKFCKIINKNKIKDKIQLNLSDGRNILIKEDKYKTNDSLLISLPKQKIKEHIELKEKKSIYIIAGKYKGEVGIIESIKDNVVSFKLKNKKFETLKKNIFLVGNNKPMITIQ